jgi:Ala-tRNA(Pro) deacylase
VSAAACRGSGFLSQPELHERLVALLESEGVEFGLTHHAPVTTSEAAAAVRGVDLATGAKAMLVKGKTELLLAVLAADRKVDWKLLAPLAGKGARFATADELEAATGLTKGAVPPLGRLFGLGTVYDESLLAVETVNFNAGTHTDSISMRCGDLIRVGGGKVASFSA